MKVNVAFLYGQSFSNETFASRKFARTAADLATFSTMPMRTDGGVATVTSGHVV